MWTPLMVILTILAAEAGLAVAACGLISEYFRRKHAERVATLALVGKIGKEVGDILIKKIEEREAKENVKS